MKTNVNAGTALILLAAIVQASCVWKAGTQSTTTEMAPAQVQEGAKQQEALEAGVEAVIYGYPLVIMDATRKKISNVAAAGPSAAPVNQFAHMPSFPAASFKDVVRANVDTLYSSAWLDLSKEPIVLSVPDTHNRFYLMPMIDAWTNIFASPGKRTTGTKPGHFAISGPGWTGTLPAGMKQLKSPTNMVWIIGRTQTNGPKEYATVHAIQKQYKLTPLSVFGKPYTPPPAAVDPTVDMKLAPVQAVATMSIAAFFNTLAALMKDNPPPREDAPVLAKLAKIGIVPGQPFDPAKLDPSVAQGLEKALPTALDRLTAAAKQVGAPVNGWRIPSMNLAAFGTDYTTRAVVALIGLGANLSADAVYPSAFVDGEGKPLSGANRYVLHFEKGQEPPARAFWSVTMYDPDSFFVPNRINRYALSSWMPFKRNADGSLDLYIQADPPGKAKAANWLPAPKGAFSLTLRMYWPDERPPSILDDTWKPPAVRPAP